MDVVEEAQLELENLRRSRRLFLALDDVLRRERWVRRGAEEKFRVSVAQAFDKEKRLRVGKFFEVAKNYGGGRSGWLGSSSPE